MDLPQYVGFRSVPVAGATNSVPSDLGGFQPIGQGGERQTPGKASTAQKTFWQAITMGCFETIKVLLEHREININQYDVDGEQRQGGTALHLAILEMPTWKGSEGRNGIQTAEFVSKMIRTLLEHGADTEMVCRYKGEWYLQTAAGKTKSFFPEGYDALGLVLQFIEITRGADVIANDVTKRLELIRDILLQHIHKQDLAARQLIPASYAPQLAPALLRMFEQGCFTDVEIKCEDRVFKAHRMVLAARSQVFERMFSSPLAESQPDATVVVKEVEPEALQSFLRFMYTDAIAECHAGHAQDLLVLANRYDVQDLKDLCTQTLARNLTVQNAASVLAIADSSHAPVLKRCALHFISENIKAIRDESDDYANLDANLMREILESVVDLQPRKRQRALSLQPHLHNNQPPATQQQTQPQQHQVLLLPPPQPHLPPQQQQQPPVTQVYGRTPSTGNGSSAGGVQVLVSPQEPQDTAAFTGQPPARLASQGLFLPVRAQLATGSSGSGVGTSVDSSVIRSGVGGVGVGAATSSSPSTTTTTTNNNNNASCRPSRSGSETSSTAPAGPPSSVRAQQQLQQELQPLEQQQQQQQQQQRGGYTDTPPTPPSSSSSSSPQVEAGDSSRRDGQRARRTRSFSGLGTAPSTSSSGTLTSPADFAAVDEPPFPDASVARSTASTSTTPTSPREADRHRDQASQASQAPREAGFYDFSRASR